VQIVERSNTKLIIANRMKEEIINKYLQHLEDNDSKFKFERAKIQEKRKQEVEDT
jgi:hypothetical protein